MWFGSWFSVKGGELAVRLLGGKLEASARVELADPSEASTAALLARSAPILALLAGDAPPEAKRILSSLEVRANGSNIEAKASASEADLMALLHGGSSGSKPAGRRR